MTATVTGATPGEAPAGCATWARGAGLRPQGSAGSPAGFVVVDWPLPWARDVKAIAGLAGVCARSDALGLRVQAVVPAAGIPEGVALYRPSPAEGFCGYSGSWAPARAGDGDAACLALDRLLAAGTPAELAPPAEAAPPVEPAPPALLVCTHGRRDRCCGSLGTTLWSDLARRGPKFSGRVVRRTSHTGGHRFAPTAILLPEGTLWAGADAELLERAATRAGPVGDAVERYRGCAGLPGGRAQALEAAVLAVEGWSVIDSTRSVHELDGARMRLVVRAGPAGPGSEWEAEVAVSREVELPECGGGPGGAKTERELSVSGLVRLR